MTATTLLPTRTRPARTTLAVDNRNRYFTWFCVSVLVVFAALWLVPTLFAVDTSLRPEGAISLHPASWWDGGFTFQAYRDMLDTGYLPDWYLNSAVIAILNAIFSVVFCSMGAFALARMRFRGRRFVSGLILAGLMIPPQVLILPMFQEFAAAHLINTYWAVILPAIPTPVAVFVFVSFFNGLPQELIDSAQVDGAGWFRIYARVFMPLCRPAISAVAIFTFVWSWNNLLWPLLVMSSTNLMTIPVGLSSVISSVGINYADVMASAVLGALPLVVVFLLFQRRIVEGIATTGIQ